MILQVGNLFARVTGGSQNTSRGGTAVENGSAGLRTASMPATTDSQSGAFTAFRRSYSQMSSFRQSSASSFSQHAWASNSNSQSASMSKDRGGSKQFVWRSESNPASVHSKSNKEVAEINSSNPSSATGFTKHGSTPATAGMAKRGKRAQSVPVQAMKKRPAAGALFDALKTFKPNKKKKTF